jgi:hypothetical protein
VPGGKSRGDHKARSSPPGYMWTRETRGCPYLGSGQTAALTMLLGALTSKLMSYVVQAP